MLTPGAENALSTANMPRPDLHQTVESLLQGSISTFPKILHRMGPTGRRCEAVYGVIKLARGLVAGEGAKCSNESAKEGQ